MPHITFIHGIANKPPADVLLTNWRERLKQDGGIDLETENITASMVYWADVLYANPEAPPVETLPRAGTSRVRRSIGSDTTEDNLIVEGVDARSANQNDDLDQWATGLDEKSNQWLASMRDTLEIDAPVPHGDKSFSPNEDDLASPEFPSIPLPWWLKERVMERFLRDVHHYLFNTTHSPRPGASFQVQDEIRRRFIAALNSDDAKNTTGGHIVVSHSMGTVIAYDCLKRVENCPAVDGLMTVGSPLGLGDIQDLLEPQWSRNEGFPSNKLRGKWINIYDRLDPVAIDARLRNDYKKNSRKVIQDTRVQNDGKWRHSAKKYLRRDELRHAMRALLNSAVT